MFQPPALVLLMGSLCCSGQSNYDPSLVLARARDEVLALSDRLPRYTCTQTVNRTYLSATQKPGPGASCDQFAGDKKLGRRKLKADATDRLRLDVLVTSGHEVYSWAGASHFDSKSVDMGGGPIGTGPFGTFVIDIFGHEGVDFQFEELTTLRGKSVLKYAYAVPAEVSHYFTLAEDKSWRTTAYSGSLWVDPEAEELERITVLTDELPPETRACTADTRVDYQRVRLGTGDFLLPLESELHFLLRDGTESNSLSQYTKCREYQAESTLSFADPSTFGEPTKAAAAASSRPIRDGLQLFLAVTKPIDTDTAAAGDVISAEVTKAVSDRGAVVIPRGAIVRGRIVRMEHRFLPAPHFLVAISWNNIELDHRAQPFSARMDRAADYDQAKKDSEFQRHRSTIWLPRGLGSAGGWFILPTTKDRYVVPAGYKTRWLTATDKPKS